MFGNHWPSRSGGQSESAGYRAVAGEARLHAVPDSVQILKPAAMVDRGPYKKPVPFGGMGGPVNLDGFSDHFPITMTVTED